MIKGKLRITRFHSGDGEASPIAHLSAFCPACDFEHSFRVDLEGHGEWEKQDAPNAAWEFNGDYDCPTFSPSMGANLRQQQEHHPLCHSFLEDGHWRYLKDCTHAMAGQTVPIGDPDPDMSFERRHGWHLFPWTDHNGRPLAGRWRQAE